MKPSELPSEYLSLAKKQAFLERGEIQEEDDIGYWFSWSDTPQGHNFWEDCCRAKTVDELPPIPTPREDWEEQFGRTGGPDHYSNLKIEPSEFIVENDMGWCEGNVIKYVSRHKDKGGADDIRKAIDYLEEILRRQYDISEN